MIYPRVLGFFQFAFLWFLINNFSQQCVSFRLPFGRTQRHHYFHENSIFGVTLSTPIKHFHSSTILPATLVQIVSENDESDDDEDSEDSDSSQTENSTADVAQISEPAQEISLIKQGLNISTILNGSDVRVGIIMARWNSDIINGLYNVITCMFYSFNTILIHIFIISRVFWRLSLTAVWHNRISS